MAAAEIHVLARSYGAAGKHGDAKQRLVMATTESDVDRSLEAMVRIARSCGDAATKHNLGGIAR
jgi:hypothetical protein